jgi:hypothetical protein
MHEQEIEKVLHVHRNIKKLSEFAQERGSEDEEFRRVLIASDGLRYKFKH